MNPDRIGFHVRDRRPGCLTSPFLLVAAASIRLKDTRRLETTEVRTGLHFEIRHGGSTESRLIAIGYDVHGYGSRSVQTFSGLTSSLFCLPSIAERSDSRMPISRASS